MEKSRTLGTNMLFVCYLLSKEANIHINLICFDRIFDHPHINVVTFVPSKQSKNHKFSTKACVWYFLEKAFDMHVSAVRSVLIF